MADEVQNDPEGKMAGEDLKDPKGKMDGEEQDDPEGKMAGEDLNDPKGKMAGEEQDDPEGKMAGEDQDDPLTVEEIFEDFIGRRTGLIKALTTDVQRVYQECDLVLGTEEEDICLFGFPDGEWQVKKPAEEVPTELPEPVLGINNARECMEEEEWLSMVAKHSDAWLIALASLLSHTFDAANRKRLFDMILGVPTILAAVESTAMKPPKEKSSVPKYSHSKSKSTSKAGSSKLKGKYSKPIQAKKGSKYGSEEEDNDKCGVCGQYDTDENRAMWIFCESCETWFHQKCVNISQAKADRIEQYNCSFCTKKKVRPGS